MYKQLLKNGLYLGTDGCKGGWITAVLDRGVLRVEKHPTKNTDIFETLSSDVTSGMLYSSLKSDARRWEISPDNTVANPSYKTTLAAMKNASDVKDVASDFFLLSKSDVEQIAQSSRIVYRESGKAYYWWLADPSLDSRTGAYEVERNGAIDDYGVEGGDVGIAPGFSVSAN